MKNINTLLTIFCVALTTLTGAVQAQNKSLRFNGTTNKVVIADHEDLNFTTEFTLEAWVYAENFKSQPWQGSVINKDLEINSVQMGYMIRIGGNGVMEGIITPGWQGAATGAILQVKKWNHVAMVFKDGEMWLYVNGSQEAYKAGLPTSINKSTADLQIGESPGFPGRVWDGKIDEVRIWNTARSQTEIQENMNASLNGDETGLVAYYNFDESDSSDTLSDGTGNGHLGELTNYGSNYTWETGYELGQNDVKISRIIRPSNSPEWSSAEQVEVEIKNVAFNAVSDVDVSFEYNGVTYQETIAETIEPWQSYTHRFNKYIDLSAKTSATIKASVLLDEDANSANNEIETTFVKDNNVCLMDRVQHNFGAQGQTHKKSSVLPDVNSDYGQLLLHIKLDCPGTGCDAWDVLGNVKITKDGKDYEIARFITPYGKACGSWTVDVSDFRSILKGSVELTSHIVVWGSSGWLLSLDLEYVPGNLDNPYTKVIPLYEYDAQVYGDPAISYDLPLKTIAIPTNTVGAHIRMTNTGHGQANTNNAAEFMEANHHVWINGEQKFTHHLWKDDCESNSCSNQNGTWQYDRAGWCPGQEVTPEWFNLADVLTPGQDMTIDYVLQDYTNQLNTGYNGGSHTEPFYRIYSYLVLSSDTPFEDCTDIAVENVDLVDGTTEGKQTVVADIVNKGSLAVEEVDVTLLINNSVVKEETLSLNLAKGEKITKEYEVDALPDDEAAHIVVAANTENDNVSSNNADAFSIKGPSGIDGAWVEDGVRIYPNPVSDRLIIQSDICIDKVEIKSIDGSLLKVVAPNNQWVNEDFSAFDAGTYLILVKLSNNQFVSKIVVKQ